jgi:hypothetical protein
MPDVFVFELQCRNELLITSTCDTDNFSLSNKDGTYSTLFEHIGFLILNVLTRPNAH